MLSVRSVARSRPKSGASSASARQRQNRVRTVARRAGNPVPWADDRRGESAPPGQVGADLGGLFAAVRLRRAEAAAPTGRRPGAFDKRGIGQTAATRVKSYLAVRSGLLNP